MQPSSCPEDTADSACASGGKLQLVSPDDFQTRFARTVRLFCQRQRMTIAQLASDAGIAENRMRKLVDNDPLERRQPTGSELLSIWSVLGPAAASRDLAPLGIIAAHAEDPGEVQLGRLLADTCGAASDLSRIAMNGRIDAEEADTAERTAETMEATAAVLRQAAHKVKPR